MFIEVLELTVMLKTFPIPLIFQIVHLVIDFPM